MGLQLPLIPETLIARGDGKQKAFSFDLKSLAALCDIVFDGDVNPEITLSVGCEIIEPPPNITQDLIVNCDTNFLGDSQVFLSMNDIFVVVSVSGP